MAKSLIDNKRMISPIQTRSKVNRNKARFIGLLTAAAAMDSLLAGKGHQPLGFLFFFDRES